MKDFSIFQILISIQKREKKRGEKRKTNYWKIPKYNYWDQILQLCYYNLSSNFYFCKILILLYEKNLLDI